MGVGDGVCHRKPIPVRGYISVAQGVTVCGPNPREGIHKAVWSATVHQRCVFDGAKIGNFWCQVNVRNFGGVIITEV